MNVERVTLSEWGDLLPQSGFEVFHSQEALEVLDEHTPGEMELYGGFKGDQPVGLAPVFRDRRSVGRALVSPPPSMGIPHMGPIVMTNSPKRRRQESVNRDFTENLLEALSADGSLALLRFICSPEYTDPRPYKWRDFDTQTRFTYRIPIEGSADDVLAGFSSSLRREVTELPELSLEIENGDVDDARQIYDHLAERYSEQDEPFSLTWEYVRDIVTKLGNRSRVYIARDENEKFLSGIIVLYSNDSAYYWEGGSRATHENVSVNSLLHWQIIQDIATDPALDSVTEYDLVGANTERLCRYKAKFNPDLHPYYVVESSGKGMDVAKSAYQLIKR
ncbi:lipid II:glycine glycyltransferase FemX [Halosimplex amylolyticum]|uniref:lipid II:glycine glycyltransferase FemX n=1 Tax=Halosimplex amylolyticum TaxID=3396616 RepID=UPI003F560B36